MENLFNVLYPNLLVPLLFPSIQNMWMQDWDDKILSDNVCNATWYLCLLPTLAKAICFPSKCCVIKSLPGDRLFECNEDFCLGSFLHHGLLQRQWIYRPLAVHFTGAKGCVFPLKGSLQTFQGSTLRQVPYLSPSVFTFILSRMNPDHLAFPKMLFWQLSRTTSGRQFSCLARWRVKEFYSSSSWNRLG